MSTFNPVASASKPSSSNSKDIDFAAMISRTTYRPGSTPYDSQLPQNYSAMLPDRVNKAFGKERFTWAWRDGEATVPEWVPPVDVR
jgi:nucleoporin NUP42